MLSLSHRKLVDQRFDFSSRAPGKNGALYDFAVVEMEGFEALSQPFRFTLTLVSEDAEVDFGAMLAHPATFTIYGPEGRQAVPYHGVLAEFDQLHTSDGYVFYRAVLVPRLWNLSLYRLSEVYLAEQPISDTLTAVLKQAGMTTNSFDFRLIGNYRPRSFVCQYEETYLEFVSRWMENDGIYYWFDHTGDEDRLVAVDHLRMHDKDAAATGERRVVPVSYRPADRMDTGVSGDTVRQFVCRRKPLPREVILQDFNHRSALQELRVSAPVDANGRGQVMLYGENFRDTSEGQRYAKLRAEEVLCGGTVFSGEGSAVGLRAGYFAQLSAHYREDFNGEYLVTEVHHQGSQAGALLSASRVQGHGGAGGETSYSNSFRAIRSDVQFRPERSTPKPRVSGTMNAIIDSEGSGQYAELDEYGQYKVQLPFDLTPKNPNKGSARVRMATPYAGSDHGMHFPLHKGAEVLLSFTDGDPDRPVIVGSVPNAENRSVVSAKNPRVNHISTAGGNQVHMDDTDGKQVMFLHSPFHNSTIGIGSVDPKGGGSILTMTAGSNETLTVGRTNSISLGLSNTMTGGYKFNIDASVGGSFAIGYSTSVGFSSAISYKKGRAISLGKTPGLKVKPGDSLAMTGSYEIMAGQSVDAAAEIEAFEDSVVTALAVSTAVQIAAAVAAGAAIGIEEKQEGDSAWNKLDDSSKLKVAQNGGESAAKSKSMAVNDDTGAASTAESTDYGTDKQNIKQFSGPPVPYPTRTQRDTLTPELQSKYDTIREARNNGEVAAVAAFKANASAGDKTGAPSGSDWGPTGTMGMAVQGGLAGFGALSGATATALTYAWASALEAKLLKSNGKDYGSKIKLSSDSIRLEKSDASLGAVAGKDPGFVELQDDSIQVQTPGELMLKGDKSACFLSDGSMTVGSVSGPLGVTSGGDVVVSGNALNLLAGADSMRLGGGSTSILSSTVEIGPPGAPSLIAENAATLDRLARQIARIQRQLSYSAWGKYDQQTLDRAGSAEKAIMIASNMKVEASVVALKTELDTLRAQLKVAEEQQKRLASMKNSIVQGLAVTQSDVKLWAAASLVQLSSSEATMSAGATELKLNAASATVNGQLIKLG